MSNMLWMRGAGTSAIEIYPSLLLTQYFYGFADAAGIDYQVYRGVSELLATGTGNRMAEVPDNPLYRAIHMPPSHMLDLLGAAAANSMKHSVQS